MTFLTPLALLWLGSLPVLVWLWRLSSAQRLIRVPSLIPFEHLLNRPPKRRSRLIVNTLFWLQLAALCTFSLALARPVWFARRGRTILTVLDTSASMGAQLGGPRVFEQARHALLGRIARKSPNDQMLVMTTAPVTALTPSPTSDAALLSQVAGSVHASHLGGNLATAVRIGRALLGSAPDETLVITDEPRPSQVSAGQVRWITVGARMPNVALVGVDAHGPLCSPAEARVIATVQNFSDAPAAVSVTATHDGRRVTKAHAEVAPNSRQAVSLPLPDGIVGWVEVGLSVQPDGLEVDNHAWIELRRTARLPIVVHSQDAAFTRTVGAWLDACPTLTWASEPPPDASPYILITDHEPEAARGGAAAMVFLRSAGSKLLRAHWVAALDHPISFYLSPVEVVAAALTLTPASVPGGVPVISALVGGRRTPVVVADERDGRRVVAMLFNPSGSDGSTPVILAFFNSLRWLMGDAQAGRTGDPVTVNGFRSGLVSVRRPDGSTETVEPVGGVVRYDAATLAGIYRFKQDARELRAAANFFNPLESNLTNRVSTWRPVEIAVSATAASVRVAHPVAHGLLIAVLVLLLVEWRWYAARARPATGAGIGPTGPAVSGQQQRAAAPPSGTSVLEPTRFR